MKKLLLKAILLLLPANMLMAQTFVNLTPKPKSMTVGTGELELPQQFVVSYGNLPAEIAAEAQRFVADFNTASGYTATASNAGNALITLSELPGAADEGYQLDVTATGVTIKARTATGFYFAFQTLKKILPANVMAGVRDSRVTRYALPVVSIQDEPRFGYRGFMLDVARHFFTVEEVKRMLDVMSYYKLNRFHWHLSDDQGWRVEIKKYPKLTTIGATAPNCYVTDFDYGPYWTNQPYGPHFYTQEDILEVVAYARERHIEVIPEIDMPGHFVAALTAYPEYSCDPNGSHVVWTTPGVSTDVLNVGNAAAVQFAKDILDELTDLFSYEYFNIGGDECPTTAWENNAECQARYRELGLTNYRQLQSHFIKDMADFLQSKGKKVVVWNEAITASGADVSLIQETNALVYCWDPAPAAALRAAQLGLDNVYTRIGPYYINRSQSTDAREANLPGTGSDNVQATYNEVPVPTTGLTAEQQAHYTGVQGTFWTEYIADRKFMEYQALPRLIAIAETGWTPAENKDFDDFCKRITADTLLLNYNGYYYARHYMLSGGGTAPGMVMPTPSTADDRHYYRLTTRATDARAGKCMELLRAGSPLISTYGSNGAAANVLWTNAQADEGDAAYDYQFWAIEEDPGRVGYYALVNKAAPNGSVNPTPTATTTAGRWHYDSTQKHYDFIIGDNGYGTNTDNSYYYSIRSDNTNNLWVNASMAGQGYAVNLYSDPSDGNGGLWNFIPVAATEVVESITLEVGKTYRFSNAIDGFNATAFADGNTGSYLRHTAEAWADDAWEVTYATTNSDGNQTVQIKNTATGRYVGAPASSTTGNVAYPVAVGSTGSSLLLTFNAATADYNISISSKNLYPVPETSLALPGIISSGSVINGYNAVRPQGAAWHIVPVCVITYQCKDTQGNSIGTFRQSVPVGQAYTCNAPAIDNFAVLRYAETGTAEAPQIAAVTEHKTVEVTYQQAAYTITVISRDQRGALIDVQTVSAPIGQEFVLEHADYPYYTFESSDYAGPSSFVPDRDLTVTDVYHTEAWNGVRLLGEAVSTLANGNSYVIYDTSPVDTERIGYRNVNPTSLQVMQATRIEGTDPYFTWIMEGTGNQFKVKNEWLGLYIPPLTQSGAIIMAAAGDTFTFTLNQDGDTWKVQGTNGQYWDGVAGSFTGWHTYGHPYRFFEYYAQPYFSVTVQFVDTGNKTLGATETYLVKAGDDFTLTAPAIDGYAVLRIENGDRLQPVGSNVTVTVVYGQGTTGIESAEADHAPNAIYDLFGRRLNRIVVPGVYIINGQKVLVR